MSDVVPGQCPLVVPHPVMRHFWDELTFLHWAFPVQQVQALLPDGLKVHQFDGQAWVSLVPFVLAVTPPRLPEMPWLGRFPETNVRTYVVDQYGREGIWFFSLDAARLPAVVAGRGLYRIPYFWSKMQVARNNDVFDYSSSRRWPGPRQAGCRLQVEVGEAFSSDELTERDHYLTARWRLFGTFGSRLIMADAVHDPWPLQKVEVRQLDDTLLAAAGLKTPTAAPIAHYAQRVEVFIGRPHVVGSTQPR